MVVSGFFQILMQPSGLSSEDCACVCTHKHGHTRIANINIGYKRYDDINWTGAVWGLRKGSRHSAQGFRREIPGRWGGFTSPLVRRSSQRGSGCGDKPPLGHCAKVLKWGFNNFIMAAYCSAR